jgi:hypothetical protein
MMAALTKPTIKDLPMHAFYNGIFTTSEKTDLSETRSSAICLLSSPTWQYRLN